MKFLIIDSHVTKASDAYSETEGMGGIASSLIYLSDCLAAEGHDVVLAIASDPDARRSGVKIVDCTKVTGADLAGVEAVI